MEISAGRYLSLDSFKGRIDIFFLDCDLLRVRFLGKDAKGTVVAEPEFYRSASAFAGGMYGSADNAMLAEIAKDIVNYTAANQ